MKAKQVFIWLCKAALSGVLAIALLTGFCFFYYNIPVQTPSDSGASDHAWQPDKFYSRATEGIAAGKTNNEGYLNSFDYTDGMEIDVLIMGSSHMEAYNVMQSESTAAQLKELMGDDAVVYNIGTSGHSFTNCAQNLDAALEKYNPKYVVVEAFNLTYTEEKLVAATNSTLPEISSGRGGIVGALQKNPFLRLLYSQLSAFGGNADGDASQKTATVPGSRDAYAALIQKMKETADSHGANLIILHHATLSILEDGSAKVTSDQTLRQTFTSICSENEIPFVDMSETFINEYNENHVLPHGFINTSVGSGHLNKHGHKMIAAALYELVGEV